MTIFTDHFSALAPDYDVVLSDVWGVVHNGVAAFPEACDALTRFREAGGVVVLITNAPRPNGVVATQVAHFGAPRSIYDAIVSSGDVTRNEIGNRPGQSIFHIGPKRDLAIFEGLGVTFAPVERADYVVCSGLFNEETETPDHYRDLLGQMLSRGLFMVCGNPDVVVERGEQLLYCAGAIADLYARLGGEVLYAGKPYAPIYDLALKLAQDARGRHVARKRVLAIGDSVRTDFKGAASYGIDCLFVTAGIHSAEFGGRDDPDPDAVERVLIAAGGKPRAIARKLKW
ncbi:MAG: TIGR01459 family HAD-type hydrolase [Pseudorhodoplanes sp.]|uniref:TIGR01459 family HAD-type hydrolase n=1 Tax=Pseudorhodoplanes sp. TaxID=1934341 RepID=UPI003D13DE20